jgi:kynureninase
VEGGEVLASRGLTDRGRAEELDAADGLARFRDRFVVADPGLIYVDGNSLGRLPAETVGRLGERVEEWGERLVRGWPDWIDLPARVGDVLAPLIGAGPGEVVMADSTTVNLYKLARAALEARPGRRVIVTDAETFPTDRYVLQGLASAREAELRLLESDPVGGPTRDDVAAACGSGDVALVSLEHVAYRSGALADLEGITAAAHEAGALVLWDLSHAAGSVPVGLGAARADLAVGCTYKYLNAGPGALAYLYVRADLQEKLTSPIWGWFGQRDQFRMGPAYDPAPGIAHFLAGTPPVLDLTAAEVGIRLVAEAGVAALRTKSVALTELAVVLHDAWLVPLGFELGTPRDPARRGGHVSLRHEEAWPICRALIERAKVVPDFRGPDSIRIGLPPLYTRFVDVWDALDRLRRLVASGEHRAFHAPPARVT